LDFDYFGGESTAESDGWHADPYSKLFTTFHSKT